MRDLRADATCTAEGIALRPQLRWKTVRRQWVGGTCGDCDVGDLLPLNQCQVVETAKTCQSPIPVPSVPFTRLKNRRRTQHPECTGWIRLLKWRGGGSPEHVYAFTPSVTDTYTFHVQPLTFDTAVYLVNDCSSPGTRCLMGGDEATEEYLVAPLSAEKTYYLSLTARVNSAQPKASIRSASTQAASELHRQL